MAPSGRQRTFELVPNAPILGQQHPGDNAQPIYSKPPMTTKQAKKLHNQKNKGPKLSKAEQRRIELMEQDRIRKEFEKEKAQARARTAREKKKAKEDKEKEERRRKGLPLVDIHPSQDTISRFISRVGRVIGVKTNSATGSTLDSVREDPETAVETGDSVSDAGDEQDDGSDKENQEPVEDPESERQAKRRRLSQMDEKSAGRTIPIASQLQAGPVAKVTQHIDVESTSRASSVDADDPINQSLLEDQILADVEQASSRKDRSMNEERPDVASAHPRDPNPQPTVTIVPVSSASNKPSEPLPLPTTLEGQQRCTNPGRKDLQLKAQAASHAPSHLGNGVFKKPTSAYVPAPRPRPAHTSPAFKLPNAPPKFKSPAVRPNFSAERPRFLPKHLNTAQRRQPPPAHPLPAPAAAYTLPTSTQAFLLDHVDEIFPSPTQEARELFEDSVTEPPKPKANPSRLSINGPMSRSEVTTTQTTAIAPYVRPETRLPAPAPAAADFFDSSLISTQDFMMSTQDILEIDTPSKARTFSAAPRLPLINKELPAPALQPVVIEGEKGTRNVSASPDSVQDRSEPPRSGPGVHQVSAVSNGAGACCLHGKFSGSHQNKEHKSSCESVRNGASPQLTQSEHSDQPVAANRPLRSSYQRHIAVATQRSTSNSSNNKITALQAPAAITTPDRPRPKKRMFGSSGPGPEGLVAMERSYQEMRRQERAREAQIRAQERLMKPPTTLVQQIDLDIAGLSDDILEDDLDESTGDLPSRRPSNTVQQDIGTQHPSTAQKATTLAASQETDYGDIDGDDFDFLKGDTSWLDEDLDDI